MDEVLRRIRKRARDIAATMPEADFYLEHPNAIAKSRQFFDTTPLLQNLAACITEPMEHNMGHGMDHVQKVAWDAGALIIIESREAGFSEAEIDRHLLLIQCAGLLHDIKRKHRRHAVIGAEAAFHLLQDLPFSTSETTDICLAIRNHEAFQETTPAGTPSGTLISDCLYDADKFRWGPDNFTHTVWDMIDFSGIPLPEFVKHFPRGMASLDRIKTTFRSNTGKTYGPQFIDIGIRIGNTLMDVIRNEFCLND